MFRLELPLEAKRIYLNQIIHLLYFSFYLKSLKLYLSIIMINEKIISIQSFYQLINFNCLQF